MGQRGEVPLAVVSLKKSMDHSNERKGVKEASVGGGGWLCWVLGNPLTDTRLEDSGQDTATRQGWDLWLGQLRLDLSRKASVDDKVEGWGWLSAGLTASPRPVYSAKIPYQDSPQPAAWPHSWSL